MWKLFKEPSYKQRKKKTLIIAVMNQLKRMYPKTIKYILQRSQCNYLKLTWYQPFVVPYTAALGLGVGKDTLGANQVLLCTHVLTNNIWRAV